MLTKHFRLTIAEVEEEVIVAVVGAVTKGTIKAKNKIGKVMVDTEVGATRNKIATEAVAIIKTATEPAAKVVVAINNMMAKIKIATGVVMTKVDITNRITTTSTEIPKAKVVIEIRRRMRKSSERARIIP